MSKPSANDIAASVRQQLRSIVRLVWDLRRPTPVSGAVERETATFWIVLIDPGAQWTGSGLRLEGLGSLSVPDERTIDKGYELAGHIYHLKDRLHQYARASELPFRKRDHPLCVWKTIDSHEELQVCGDLVNFKKHGRHENRSKRNPTLGNVVFDTSVCGPVEVQHDGSSKATAILASNANSVPRAIELLSNGELWRESSLDVFVAALEAWRPLITESKLLESEDSESEFLRMVLSYDNAP